MSKSAGEAETTTFATDLRRLVVLALLTALAVLVCERWSEAGVIEFDDPAGSNFTRSE